MLQGDLFRLAQAETLQADEKKHGVRPTSFEQLDAFRAELPKKIEPTEEAINALRARRKFLC